jgi:hypothetical protein
MIGMRRLRPLRWGRPTFASASVFALLALACFPVLAQADSSGIQYGDAPPTATTPGSEIPSRSAPPAKASGANGGAAAPDSTVSGSSESNPSAGDESSTEAGGAAKGGDRGTGQGSPDKGAAKAGAPGAKALDVAPVSEDDGGSSPLVPILIVAAILAAISIGAYALRQRRQRRGPTHVSPEAG